ncbi:lipopolysaccharide-induced tumor necrosis factor-alpha factor-like isoform X2 [Pectinophora gossypiella]|uniref:lipopolysaccharide-induced tumor necrosis factor-alpha factor-like isoform X2 n=2 Tax=Pectinophora gossypiella TaxID=13191 RepID=UPI00214E23E2|nr:lipopolysaccharide-induced tumor necrosis factor-alpha factor-like isoform X2 [Pectinophora gossypiella]
MHSESVPLYPPETLPMKDSNTNNSMGQSTPIMGPSAPFPLSAPAQTIATGPVLLGPENTVTTCPFCHASVMTAIKYTTTTRTHITALLYCLICCCCCIGYCSNSAKNTDHFCPNCQRYLGTYEK